MQHRSVVQILVAVVHLVTRLLLREFFRVAPDWLDYRTDDPIMRERINAGSDKYFAWHERKAEREGGWEVEDASESLRVRLGKKKLRLPRNG